MEVNMHSLFGFLILAATGAFLVFAFRQGTGVRRSDRRDDGAAVNLRSDSGSSHHSGDGFGHG
jgi:hypothetical protein